MPTTPTPPQAKTIKLTLDGRSHQIRIDQLGAKETRMVRQATGMSWRAWLATFETDFDSDSVAVLLWMARVRAGEDRLTLEEVEDHLGYQSDLLVELVDDDESDVPDNVVEQFFGDAGS